jgi:hypothetical protein
MADGVYSEVGMLMSGITSQLAQVQQTLQQLHVIQTVQQQMLTQIVTGQATTNIDLVALASTLQQVLAAVDPPEAAFIRFGWGDDIHEYKLTSTGETILMSDLSLPDSDSATCTLQVLDEAKNPFTPATPPTYTPDSTTFITLTPAADGMTCEAVPVEGGGIGTTNITIQVTNDSGSLAQPLANSVTTKATDAGEITAAWADSGPTVTVPAAPPAEPPAAPPAA